MLGADEAALEKARPVLEAYAARVAATVGAMMTLLMGVRDTAAIARACDLGIAMQFTNIARDIGEDARARRRIGCVNCGSAREPTHCTWPSGPAMTGCL